MIVVGTPAKNEEWVLGLSARVSLQWADHVVFLNDGSTDGTPTIMSELQAEYGTDRVTVGNIVGGNESEWNDMTNRQKLIEVARERVPKMTHFCIVDADEVLTANLVPTIRDVVTQCPQNTVLQLPLLNCWGFANRVRTDSEFQGWLSFAFKDDSRYHWKPRDQGYQFHHRQPMPLNGVGHHHRCDGGVMHLQFARTKAVEAKQALYKMVEVLRWEGRSNRFTREEINKKYSWWRKQPAHVYQTPDSWLHKDLMEQHLDMTDDGNSWQAKEVRRLYQEFPGRFEGLDLFGVV